MPLVSASLSTSPPTKPARSSLANLCETGLPVGGEVSWGSAKGKGIVLWNCVVAPGGGLTFFLLVVFPQLHAFEGCGSADHFVAEFGLVLVAAGAVDFLVGVAGFIWGLVSIWVNGCSIGDVDWWHQDQEG